MTFKFSAVVLL